MTVLWTDPWFARIPDLFHRSSAFPLMKGEIEEMLFARA
jgi:hypothetical protein